MTNICYSGGAKGADLAWGEAASQHGHEIRHFVFEGHGYSSGIVLSEQELREAQPALNKANRMLKRNAYPRNPVVHHLLQRNWYQVRETSTLYAISTLDPEGWQGNAVSGGTAWAVQMFIDRFEGKPCMAFVYDQNTSRWFTWDRKWEEVDFVPPPSGKYTGVGTRELLSNGREAIFNAYV